MDHHLHLYVLFWAYFVFVLLVAAYGVQRVRRAWRLWSWWARVRDTELGGVAHAREGTDVALHGVAKPAAVSDGAAAAAPAPIAQTPAQRRAWHLPKAGLVVEPFLLRDDTGTVEVRPRPARLVLRDREGALMPGTAVYVLGRFEAGAVRGEILVSDRSRESLASDVMWTATGHTLLALALLAYPASQWATFAFLLAGLL